MSLRRAVHTVHKESDGSSVGRRWMDVERSILLEIVVKERQPLILAAKELDRSFGGVKAQLMTIGLTAYQMICTPHCYMAPTVWKEGISPSHHRWMGVWTDSLVEDALSFGFYWSPRRKLLVPHDLAGKEVNEKFYQADVKKLPPRYSHFTIEGLSLSHR